MSASAPQHAGVEVVLGGTTYVMPPISLGAVKRLAKRIQGFQEADLEGQMTLAGDVAFEALKRNYPDLEREEMDELIDMGNFLELFNAAMNVSGFAPTTGGGSGNVAGSGQTPTGRASTPTSPPASAGRSTTSTAA